jgi:hypothetical protein
MFFDRQPYGRLKCLLGVGFLATNTSLAVWSQSGLETNLLALLIVSMCLRFEVEMCRRNPFPWSAVLFGLAWMTRPEVPIYSLYFLGRRWSGRSVRPWSKSDLWWLLTAAALILPYEAWGLWYYGRLFPTTHVAKLGEASVEGISIRRMFRQPELVEFVTRQGWGLPALLAASSVGAILGRKTLRIALWLIPACGLVFVLYARSDWMPRNRFFIPILPLLSLWVGYGLGELLRAARGRSAAFLVCALMMAVFGLNYVGAQMFAGEPGGHLETLNRESKMPRQGRGFWFFDVPERLSMREYPLENSAMFMLRKIPPGETICLRDIGFPGYLTMNPIWDTAGLVTPTAARARRDRSTKMQQAMFDELLAIRPAAFRLILPKGRRRHINWRIQSWLETDPAARVEYERVRPRSELTEDTSLVVYLRRDLPEVDFAERLDEALVRLPEYADRAREKLLEQKRQLERHMPSDSILR